jgi:hypothetical protein
MKILAALLVSLQLFAFDTQSAALIFEKLFHAISHKKEIKVYTDSAQYIEVIGYAKTLHFVKQSHEADIALLTQSDAAIKEISDKIIVFTTSPQLFSEHSNAVGAFFWHHGRPKILFHQKRLEKHNISLDPSFKKYLVSELP